MGNRYLFLFGTKCRERVRKQNGQAKIRPRMAEDCETVIRDSYPGQVGGSALEARQ